MLPTGIISQSDKLHSGTIVTVSDATYWYHCLSLTCYALVKLSQSDMLHIGTIVTV
ncbi:hypothetical protein DPMN_094137 [Dreissena polymorpha]|uniref:Uncharacterized protein n=1 Tax=Dreissena polymorpha TaxID=45954 RepID=A0A9D4R1N8_DREPO|nr:hypothetical protein DPMN_094137 [Dreissena polymorpha]